MTPRDADATPIVILIDDDDAVRASLDGLFRSVGLRVRAFASVQAYLSAGDTDLPGCMVLDVRLPGQSGLDFYDALAKQGVCRPAVFISAHADVPMTVRAMKAGAMEFLTKPVRSQELLDAVQQAIERDRERRAKAREIARLVARSASLTAREREIMALVVAGRRNKQIAADIGLSEATVKLHRGHIMQKMNADSVAGLVRMADALSVAGMWTARA